jgi:hypothetical protein
MDEHERGDSDEIHWVGINVAEMWVHMVCDGQAEHHAEHAVMA